MNISNHLCSLSLCLAISASVSSLAHAGQYTATKNKACPDAWSITDKAIPIVDSDSDPWGESVDGVDDKALAKSHLVSSKPIETVSMLPVTSEDLINDPLTVASECLVYRNFEADTVDAVASPAPTPNPATGWVPAVIY